MKKKTNGHIVCRSRMTNLDLHVPLIQETMKKTRKLKKKGMSNTYYNIILHIFRDWSNLQDVIIHIMEENIVFN